MAASSPLRTPSSPTRSSYLPVRSSPLNPSSPVEQKQQCHSGRIVRRRRSRRGAKHTLCARLLRAKAASAWRERVMMLQYAQYENSCAMQQAAEHQEYTLVSGPRVHACNKQHHHHHQHQHQHQHQHHHQQPYFRKPSLSATPRVMLPTAALPAMKYQHVIRPAVMAL